MIPERPSVTVRYASVVLVSQSPIDRHSIKPDALVSAGIVPPEWIATEWPSFGGIYPPPVARTSYQNGFSIQAEGNRCVFQELIGGAFQESYQVHSIVQRYAQATKLVPYSALGINWLLDIFVEDPHLWIREKLLGNGGQFPDFWATSLQITKTIDTALCYLNFTIDNQRIVADCNYHFPLVGGSPRCSLVKTECLAIVSNEPDTGFIATAIAQKRLCKRDDYSPKSFGNHR